MFIRAPALFMSHGAPMFALEPGLAGPALTGIGQSLRHTQAIIVVSAHWITDVQVYVTGADAPDTIHDFRGFPEALYALRYPAPGHPHLARRIVEQLCQEGWEARVDPRRGLDHGAWVPLVHLRPAADVPVIQVSLPVAGGPDLAWQLGRALAPWRDAGVLIAGSGTLTHNLYDLQGPGDAAAQYVPAFTDWVREHVVTLDHAAVRNYRQQAPAAQRAHPTEEHFLPLLVAMGAADAQEPVYVVDGGVEYGALAMDAYVFGHMPSPDQADQDRALTGTARAPAAPPGCASSPR